MNRPNTSKLLPLTEYDKVIVAFSGGKDSTAALLHLFDLGVPREKIELWHHDVDGGSRLMDWPVTTAYCDAVAQALGVRLLKSWRRGGFLREMLRSGTPTAPVTFQRLDGTEELAGGSGPNGTRLKFPQVSADLKVRWCSAYLKIDVARRVFANDERFKRGKFLFITGERREESASRAKYAEIEEHPSTTATRRVDQWRAVIDWRETAVWEIIRRWRVRPHPAYELGWGRVSCALCIFGDPNQWASARKLLPGQFAKVAEHERRFMTTIQRGRSVVELADAGESFLPDDPELLALATGETYPRELALVAEGAEWKLPAGAYKRAGGPT